jgi:hypothetical protein
MRPLKDKTTQKHYWVVEFPDLNSEELDGAAVQVKAKSRQDAIKQAMEICGVEPGENQRVRASRID